jgi:hypothetical protein
LLDADMNTLLTDIVKLTDSQMGNISDSVEEEMKDALGSLI